MKTDIWKAVKLLLDQFLKLDINEQLAREIDYLKAENQVLKNRLAKSGKRMKSTDEQRRLLAVKAKALGKRLTEVDNTKGKIKCNKCPGGLLVPGLCK